ncbi:MAG: competence/damage-inducible protein A [Bacteroidia bacterium]
MKAEIISIGDEILIGQINNTNSVWIAQQLNLIGVPVIRMTTIGDTKEEIVNALIDAEKRAQLILITGGLGPTKDDVTKKTLADYFNMPLEMDEEVLKHVKSFFERRGREMIQSNIDQALVPKGCKVIHNPNGTAPGMWFTKDGRHVVSMPGVPYEMKKMISEDVIPFLLETIDLPFIYHRTVLTQGLGESFLAQKIEDWENNLAGQQIKLAYLPSPGIVRLRLSAVGKDEEKVKKQVDAAIEKLHPIIGKYVYGYEEFGQEPPSIQSIVLDLLKKKGKTFSIAESCTGGALAASFTAIAGCSEFFKGGIVPYTNEAKNSLVGVDNAIFEKEGAVSEACVISLAVHAVKLFKSDYALSVSGIAGPSGGTANKPVGFVWMAVSNGRNTEAKSFQFGTDRLRNIEMTVQSATNLLRKFIESDN